MSTCLSRPPCPKTRSFLLPSPAFQTPAHLFGFLIARQPVLQAAHIIFRCIGVRESAASELPRRASVLQIDMSFQNVNETLHGMEVAVHVFALLVELFVESNRFGTCGRLMTKGLRIRYVYPV